MAVLVDYCVLQAIRSTFVYISGVCYITIISSTEARNLYTQHRRQVADRAWAAT